MRFLLRLLGAIGLATLIVTVAFTYLEVREERIRLVKDLGRRAALAADAVRESAEPLVARQARVGYDRILKRYGRPDRAIAIYDQFGSVIEASREVKPLLPPLSPLISDAIRTRGSVRDFRSVGGVPRLVYAVIGRAHV